MFSYLQNMLIMLFLVSYSYMSGYMGKRMLYAFAPLFSVMYVWQILLLGYSALGVACSNILFSKNISDFLYNEDKYISFTYQEKIICYYANLFRIDRYNNNILIILATNLFYLIKAIVKTHF